MYKRIAGMTVGKRGYSQWERGQLGLLSGQAFYILGPNGRGGVSDHRAWATPHAQLPSALLTASLLPGQRRGQRTSDLSPKPTVFRTHDIMVLLGTLHTLCSTQNLELSQTFMNFNCWCFNILRIFGEYQPFFKGNMCQLQHKATLGWGAVQVRD